jgi:5'-methylthioadenosine phosphorylase
MIRTHKEEELVEIAILGGTGVYDPQVMQNAKQIKIYTPFGETSDMVTIGTCLGRRVAFIPRHGNYHHAPPHSIPAHANIWALKELGVTRILAPSAVGSLQPHFKPGELLITDQFIDFTKTRNYTYFHGGQVAHVSLADPFCKELRQIAIDSAAAINLPIHKKGTLVCIEGPRFSTRAESLFYQKIPADAIGMTVIPECALAREMEMCYLSIAAATDYDAWHEEPVSNKMVLDTMKQNMASIKKLLLEIIPRIPSERSKCECPHALENALM